jgi:uncharacterized protein
MMACKRTHASRGQGARGASNLTVCCVDSLLLFGCALLSIATGQSINTAGNAPPGFNMKLEKISFPNMYRGYSEVLYSDHVRYSQYVPGKDGIKIAVDIYLPALHTVPVDKPMPVVLLHYRTKPRAETDRGLAELKRAGVFDMLARGYVVIWAQQRGSGASFGPQKGFVTPVNGEDVKALIAWAAKQSWSTGKVAMMGGSHGGFIQWITTASLPPELLAITPAVTTTNFYPVNFPGGVSSMGTPGQPGAPARDGRAAPVGSADPVDEDVAPEFPLLKAAAKSQTGNIDLQQEYLPHMHRDTFSPSVGYAPMLVDPPINYAKEIESSGVRSYNFAGWFDLSPGLQFLDYRQFGEKILIGPWAHETSNPVMVVERLRWFDRYLKGIANQVDLEPPVYYYTINAPPGQEWNFAADWPIPTEIRTKFYFAAGRTGTVASQNDGGLSLRGPTQTDAADTYKVDPDVSAFGGRFNRMERRWSGDMAADVDSRGLSYTAAPFEQNTEITGHPIVHLWVTSTAKDGDFIAWIEDVGTDGKSTFVTDGAIRGSHRKLQAQQPWDDMGLPYHPSMEADALPLPQVEPAELVFDAYPISYVFRQGHRIRITITGGEKNTYQPPPGFDKANPPTIRVYREGKHASYVDLPVIPAESKFFAGTASAKNRLVEYTGPAQLYLGSDRAFLRLGSQWIRCIASTADRVAKLPSALVCKSGAGPLNVRVSRNRQGECTAALTGSNISFEGAIPKGTGPDALIRK